jgi:CubicO group peptidase (beta-lactamase class C family)
MGALILSCSHLAGADANLESCRKIGLSSCPMPFDAVVPAAKDMLVWNQADRVVGFRNTYRQYRADVFHADRTHIRALPPYDAKFSEPRYSLAHRQLGLQDYLKRQNVTGFLVLKYGKIVYQYYAQGNTESTLWTSRSVGKSIVSILVGIAIREGFIKSVDDPVTDYLPELKETAWDGTTLQNLLQHTSGVNWNENYDDPQSDFAHLTRCEAREDAYDCTLKLVRSVTRKPGVSPGEIWSYNTGGAWLVGRTLERATRMSIARYLETRVWRPFGMESDGVWEAYVPGEVDMGGHGFNATLRDWGRFALFVANEGQLLPGGESLLAPGWIAESTRWTQAKGSVTKATPDGQYGYQWWHLGLSTAGAESAGLNATTEDTLWAEGIYGQTIAIDPVSNLVMVQWSTTEKADMPDAFYDEQLLLFNALEQSLSASRQRSAISAP